MFGSYSVLPRVVLALEFRRVTGGFGGEGVLSWVIKLCSGCSTSGSQIQRYTSARVSRILVMIWVESIVRFVLINYKLLIKLISLNLLLIKSLQVGS